MNLMFVTWDLTDLHLLASVLPWFSAIGKKAVDGNSEFLQNFQTED